MSASPSVSGLELPAYRGLKPSLNGSVLTITLCARSSHLDLWYHDTRNALADDLQRLQVDNATKRVISHSDVPGSFITHLDLLEPTIVTCNHRVGLVLFPFYKLAFSYIMPIER